MPNSLIDKTDQKDINNFLRRGYSLTDISNFYQYNGLTDFLKRLKKLDFIVQQRLSKNSQHRKEYRKRWTKANRKKLNASHRKWYSKNKESRRQYQKNWMAKNPEKNKANQQKNQQKHRAELKEFREWKRLKNSAGK